MQSKARTVVEYLKSLPAERRKVLEQVRKELKSAWPKGIQEQMQYGMIGYTVPLSKYLIGYLHDPAQPLPFAGLAAQKNYYALYLMCTYGEPKFDKMLRDGYKKNGIKLDMGKGCIRFKNIEALDLKTLKTVLKKQTVDGYIKQYVKARAGRK